MIRVWFSAIVSAASLAGCSSDDPSRITAENSKVYDGITADEIVRFNGTEPFWGGEVAGERLRYTTSENLAGTTIAVRRFAGLNGVGYSGTLEGAAFDMAVTPGECGDGMSDRTYPYHVVLRIGDDTRNGCAFTEAQPFEGSQIP